MQSRLGTFLLGLAVAAPLSLAFAQKETTKQPSKDGKTSKYSHPNLMAADKLCAQAFAKLEAAQVANEYDLGGHAKKAKDLLKEAQDEIKLATVAATKK
jgi:hypothetical protein